jgi:cytochrome c peroxidase
MKQWWTIPLLLVVVAPLAWWSDAGLWLWRFVDAHRTPQFHVPSGWPAPTYDFSANPVTPAGFRLGRALFYEPRLSRDGTVSCGSCHQQFAAFAHFDHRVSHGIGGVNGVRNAPALFNLAWQPDFMRDGAVHHLELQPIAPISNPLEMGESLAGVVAKLRADPAWAPRFAAAFGSTDIDSRRVLLALTQFVGTLISSHSRYDDERAGRHALDARERAGLAVFRAHCAGCHAEPLLTDFSYRNDGLDAVPRDIGRAAVTGKAEDAGRFRVPSLRNVALTAPYMHDGRFETLEQVLDHYASGIQPSATLDPALARGIVLSADERAALLSFLQSLSDRVFVSDARFSEASTRR